jgi:2-(3-amino-3-carboxypropyl)histidine synthase
MPDEATAEALAAAAGLPQHYHFEIAKTIARIKERKARRVALQFPEGLLMFAVPIADILEHATGAEMIILGDVTYGACCVDDQSAASLGADFLVHYGHSCLVSIKDCVLANMMYVFVEIDLDVAHLVETAKKFIQPTQRVLCVATIQFVASMRAAVSILQKEHMQVPITVPQSKPLSGGELLGCTSPKIDADAYDVVLYVADGRFHLESLMIHNPQLPLFYQYDPYKKVLSKEAYDFDAMKRLRGAAIQKARSDCRSVGLIMGTLGRQGNPRLVEHLKRMIEASGRSVTVFLMSEIFPTKLERILDVDCFVQVACPRLSIDWGYAFDRPLLSPYEAEVAFGTTTAASAGVVNAPYTTEEEWMARQTYPMDHYSKAGGTWAVYSEQRPAGVVAL